MVKVTSALLILDGIPGRILEGQRMKFIHRSFYRPDWLRLP